MAEGATSECGVYAFVHTFESVTRSTMPSAAAESLSAGASPDRAIAPSGAGGARRPLAWRLRSEMDCECAGMGDRLAASDSHKIVCAGGKTDREVTVWDAAMAATKHQCPETARSVAIEGETVAVGLHDGRISLFAAGEPSSVLQGHTGAVIGLAMRDGIIYSGGGDATVRLWDATCGECVNTLAEHTDKVFSVAAAADGTCVSASRDTTVRVWRAASVVD